MTTTAEPPRLQIAQILADLSDLNVAEPDAALALVTAHRHLHAPQQKRTRSKSKSKSKIPPFLPDASRFDRPGQGQGRRRRRRMSASLTPSSSFSRRDSSGSGASMSASASGKATPSPATEADPDLERAVTLMHLYEIRAWFKQQENAGLARARANVEAVAERYGRVKEGDRARVLLGQSPKQ